MNDFGTRGHKPMPRPDKAKESRVAAAECKVEVWSRERMDAHWASYPAPPDMQAPVVPIADRSFAERVTEKRRKQSEVAAKEKGYLKEVTMDKIGGGLHTLTRDQLILLYQAGMVHKQIAAAYGIKERAVKLAARDMQVDYSRLPQFQNPGGR